MSQSPITVLTFVRNYLNMMSDMTFLASIENINFRNKIVTIKSGYWKKLVMFIKSKDLTNHFTSLGPILKLVKEAFVSRFASVSATKLKQFFDRTIFNSFYDFKNMMYYVYNFMTHGNPGKKDFEKLRRIRYFERKAKKFYNRYLENLNVENFDNQVNDNIVDENQEIDNHYEEDNDPIVQISEEAQRLMNVKSVLTDYFNDNNLGIFNQMGYEDLVDIYEDLEEGDIREILKFYLSYLYDQLNTEDNEEEYTYEDYGNDWVRQPQETTHSLHVDQERSYTSVTENIGSASNPIHVVTGHQYYDGTFVDLSDQANVESTEHISIFDRIETPSERIDIRNINGFTNIRRSNIRARSR